MKLTLSNYLNEETIKLLRREIDKGQFPGITFEQAMQFLLTDGIFPASDLPVVSFLKLEDWVQTMFSEQTLSYTTSELKNKTGEILQKVMQGKTIQLVKHGRVIAEINSVYRQTSIHQTV